MDSVVLVSCGYEWKALVPLFPGAQREDSPVGEWFAAGGSLFLWGGFGKIAAAASAQYAVDRWRPRLLVNIGTCGGFEGEVGRGEVLLAERTVVYDIDERMTDPDAAIAHFTTVLDLSWLPSQLPQPARRATLVSADGDLDPCEIPRLKARYGAVAVSSITMTVGALLFLITSLAEGSLGSVTSFSLKSWALLVYLGVAAVGIGYLLYFEGLRRVTASRGTALFYMKPVLATVFAWIILGEALSAAVLTAAGLAAVGILAVTLERAEKGETARDWTED